MLFRDLGGLFLNLRWRFAPRLSSRLDFQTLIAAHVGSSVFGLAENDRVDEIIPMLSQPKISELGHHIRRECYSILGQSSNFRLLRV